MDSLIPPWFRNVLIAVAALWVAYQLFDYGRDVEAKTCQADEAAAAASSSESLRSDEAGTSGEQKEASDAHVQAILQLVDQRNAADAAAQRLRQQLAQALRTASRCGAAGDPAAEQSRQAVAALGAVFAACEARYRDVAAAAAGHLAAGQHCEADYDALTPTKAQAGHN